MLIIRIKANQPGVELAAGAVYMKRSQVFRQRWVCRVAQKEWWLMFQLMPILIREPQFMIQFLITAEGDGFKLAER